MPFLSPGGARYWQVVLCVAFVSGLAVPVGAASQEAERLNQRAAALTNQGQFEEAAEPFMSALRLSPNDEVIRRNLSGLRPRWGRQLLRAGALDQSPYSLGSVAIGYLVERCGMTAIQQLLRRTGEGRAFTQALQDTFQMDVAALQQDLRDLLVGGN